MRRCWTSKDTVLITLAASKDTVLMTLAALFRVAKGGVQVVGV